MVQTEITNEKLAVQYICNIQCSPTWCLAAPVMLAARKFWRREVTSISTCRVTLPSLLVSDHTYNQQHVDACSTLAFLLCVV